jgi:hypothetical protein
MLALVSVVEITLDSHPLRFNETASFSWRTGLDAIPREASRADVVCLGDSLVKIGLIPEVIRAGSGLTTYNFAMAQAPAPASYFALRRLLDAGGTPSAVVVDFKPSVLVGGPRFSLRHWQTVLSFRECLELANEVRSVGMLLEILKGRLLPSYRDRLEIRESIRSALKGETSPTYVTNRLAERNWGKNLGAHLNSPRTTYEGTVAPEILKKLLPDVWKCHRLNATYVDRTLALAESRKIPVFWLIPPLSPDLQGRSEQAGVDAAFVAFVRSMQSKHPGVIVIDGRHSGYDASTFSDHNHLNVRGSVAMSRELASIVGRRGDRPRWIDLPRFEDRPINIPLEDVDQSRVALEAEATRR